MLAEIILAAAIASPQNLSTGELQKYYWDCDTMFMKGELGGQDMWSCLAITDELKQRMWNDDHSKFVQWWRERRHREWGKRGYVYRPE